MAQRNNLSLISIQEKMVKHMAFPLKQIHYRYYRDAIFGLSKFPSNFKYVQDYLITISLHLTENQLFSGVYNLAFSENFLTLNFL